MIQSYPLHKSIPPLKDLANELIQEKLMSISADQKNQDNWLNINDDFLNKFNNLPVDLIHYISSIGTLYFPQMLLTLMSLPRWKMYAYEISYIYIEDNTDIEQIINHRIKRLIKSGAFCLLNYFQQLTHLTKLNMYYECGFSYIEKWNKLSYLTNLKSLYLYLDDSPVPLNSGLQIMPQLLPNLMYLSITNEVSKLSLRVNFTEMLNLKGLSLSSEFRALNLNLPDSLTSLTIINKYYRILPMNFSNISTLTKLKNLRLKNIDGKDQLCKLSNLTSLRILELNNVNEKKFPELKLMTNLRFLNLSHNKVSKVSFTNICNYNTALNTLELKSCTLNKFSPKVIRWLTKLDNLNYLDLEDNSLNNNILFALKSLKRFDFAKNQHLLTPPICNIYDNVFTDRVWNELLQFFGLPSTCLTQISQLYMEQSKNSNVFELIESRFIEQKSEFILCLNRLE